MNEPTGRSWLLRLPPGTRLMTANQRPDWARKMRQTRELREAMGWVCRAKKVPPISYAHIFGLVIVPARDIRRRRDPANWSVTAKACVDALVDMHVLEDDDWTRILGPDMRLLPGARPGTEFALWVGELKNPPRSEVEAS